MLEVKNLRKQYGKLTAVNGISFDLHPGDVFGFIGSNGAGKTTTIKMLATLLEPTAGTAILNGADIRKHPMEVKRLLGYMPDFFGLYDDVKVWEYLDFFATIYDIPANQRPGIIDNVLELTNLTVKKNDFVQSLSRGMQQRLCLARCLVHDPYLLLLDEPASGLDPRARAELKELIAELGRMGKIVIVSSHILSELADFCNTVGIIERGNLLAFGPVEQVVRGFEGMRILHLKTLDDPASLIAPIRDLPHVLDTAVSGENSLRVEYAGDHEAQAEFLKTLVRAGYKVFGLTEEVTNLEDIFLKLTTGAVQ